MSNYRRVLALVDFASQAEAVARRGLQIARAHGAVLALAAVMDYTPGEECEDCIPVMTPQRMRTAIEKDIGGKLLSLADRVGAAGAEVIAVTGSWRSASADLVSSWKPDLVVVAAHARRGLEPGRGDAPFDLLTLRAERSSLSGRLVRALAAAL